jgi:hypothetical protein
VRTIAIIGDIVLSKDIPRRDAFQRKLGSALESLGGTKGSGLASPFTITLGDEFQAVYRTPQGLWADAISLLASLHPVQVRFGIGAGELTTKLNAKQALGMDGPAFHRARAAIGALKGGEGRFRIEGEDETEWALANHALSFLSHYLTGWSKNRLHVLAALLHGRTVSDFERELPISKVAIYKNINAAALDDVANMLHAIGRSLDKALHDE